MRSRKVLRRSSDRVTAASRTPSRNRGEEAVVVPSPLELLRLLPLPRGHRPILPSHEVRPAVPSRTSA